MPKRKRARTKIISVLTFISSAFAILSLAATVYSWYFPTVPQKVSVIPEEPPKIHYYNYIYFRTAPINAGEYVNGTITFYNIERYLPMFYIIAEGKLSTINAQNPTPINPDYSSEGKPYTYSPESKTFKMSFSFKANSSTIYLFLIPQEFSNFKFDTSAYVVRNMSNSTAGWIYFISTIVSTILAISLRLKS